MLCGEHKPFALVINKSHNPSSSRPIFESTCVSIRHVDYLLSFLLLSMYTVLIFLSCNGNIALTCKSMLLSDFQSQKTIEKQSAATSQRLPDLSRISLTRTLVPFFPPPAVGFCYLKGATRSPPVGCEFPEILKCVVDAARLR